MATKSRLGKGLGALFPSLPGEPQHQEHAAPAAAAKEVKASKTDGHVESKSASATAQASVNAVQGMKHAVSRETTKKNQHRRASMPAISLNESAHPADMFFGSTAQPASEQGEQQGSVSRETTPTEHKKDEPELLPVQGGYLVELRLSDVGPNLHQPRTIFDEDDLRELAESIKEVGVLQPIVVRKRPQSQIEAARREAAAKPAEPHNMFDGRMDSMYELIMGERRWRASQIAGLKTIPAIVKTTADDDMLRDALLENLHRVALNPLEEAGCLPADDRRFRPDAGPTVQVGVEIPSANRQHLAIAQPAGRRAKEGRIRTAVRGPRACAAGTADGSGYGTAGHAHHRRGTVRTQHRGNRVDEGRRKRPAQEAEGQQAQSVGWYPRSGWSGAAFRHQGLHQGIEEARANRNRVQIGRRYETHRRPAYAAAELNEPSQSSSASDNDLNDLSLT